MKEVDAKASLFEEEKEKKKTKPVAATSLPEFVEIDCGGQKLQIGIPTQKYTSRSDMHILMEAEQLTVFFNHVLKDLDEGTKRSYKRGSKRARAAKQESEEELQPDASEAAEAEQSD